VRIIGCGNRQRGDDGAGILVAERLRHLGIDAGTCSGEATELIETWAGSGDVILIDAVVTGAPGGTVHVWDGLQKIDPPGKTASTHGLGVAQAIELARVLNRLPERLRIYGIEGRAFDPGFPISSQVHAAIEEVVQRIIADVSASADAREGERPKLRGSSIHLTP